MVLGSTFVFNPPNLTDAGWSVLRLSPAGAPDGFGGSTFSEGSDPANGANALGLQPDGKLLMAGTNGGMGGDVTIGRLGLTGAYDTGFGGTGHPSVDFAGARRRDDRQ